MKKVFSLPVSLSLCSVFLAITFSPSKNSCSMLDEKTKKNQKKTIKSQKPNRYQERSFFLVLINSFIALRVLKSLVSDRHKTM